MDVSSILPGFPGLSCDEVVVADDLVTVGVSSALSECRCPQCGWPSRRVHSRYDRRLADLPWQGRQVILRWRTGRWFCDNPACSRRTFAERQPDIAAAHARRTSRLTAALAVIGLTCGGEASARLAARLAMPASSATVLRILRGLPLPAAPAPRVVGVDDWAFRRGLRYGTILCDLERHRVVDLLPERSSSSFATWLQTRPEIEVISRDRGEEYTQGATTGASQAIQVADRWHLLRNLREALVRVVARYPAQIRAAAQQTASNSREVIPSAPQQEPLSVPALSTPQRLVLEHRQQRQARCEAVWALHGEHVSGREIAQRLGLHRSTVRRFLATSEFPERAKRRYHRSIEPWEEPLLSLWNGGCHNARTLTAELERLGFRGSYDMVRRAVGRWRERPHGPASSPAEVARRRAAASCPSANSVAWLMLKSEAEDTPEQQSLKAALYAQCPPLKAAATTALEFRDMVKRQAVELLDGWLNRAEAATSPVELRRFAQGLRQDLAAVRAALSLPWSNGQTEGQVNRLKTLKRQMYGRANFDLLRKRFLLAA